jgi:MYXO-CTERM domain-containing protein
MRDRIKTTLRVAVGGALLAWLGGSTPVRAAVVFSDNFESGNMNNWTLTTAGGTGLTASTDQNVVPSGGSFSAKLTTSAARMHHNLLSDNGGAELNGPSTFTSYIYDASGTASRIFNEVRGYSGGTGLPNGGTTASGSLAQLLAIGKYNTVTMGGEVYDGTKYQARVTFTTAGGTTAGWFNLNGPGAPSRSTGWHKFDVERLADGTTLNFYVDDILSRTITGATAQSWDTVVLGPGLGTTVGDAYIDGFQVTNTAVPEPAALGLIGLGALALRRRRRA